LYTAFLSILSSRRALSLRGAHPRCQLHLFLVPSCARGSSCPLLRGRGAERRSSKKRLPAPTPWRLSSRDRSSGRGRTSTTSPLSGWHLRRPSVRPVQPLKGSSHLRRWARAVVRDDPERCLR
jgi:hypothetical protein